VPEDSAAVPAWLDRRYALARKSLSPSPLEG